MKQEKNAANKAPAEDKVHIKEAHFLFGSPTYPPQRAQNLPEIAIFGRSNVGKSTLVNSLLARKSLAKTSATPGCTKNLNFYYLRAAANKQEYNLCLVDVPGFGFAKFSKDQRERLSQTVVEYVKDAEQLSVAVILNDSRRMPEQDEIALRDLAANSGRAVVVVLTKCDKLNRNETAKAVKDISKAYGLEGADLVLSGKGIDPSLVWKRVLADV